MNKICFFLLFLFIANLNLEAQEVSATVLDAGTKRPVPFATVQYGSNKGVVTNEEGRFSILSKEIDSISISCLGYETQTFSSKMLENDSIYLKSSSIKLDDVFLSNKNLTGEEIIERVLEKVDENYNFGLTQKKFFLRNSFFNFVNRFEMEVEESTMPELDQEFMNELENKMPKYMDSYDEYLGSFYGNYDNQKVQLIKADKLDNPVNDESLKALSDKVEKTLQEKVGEGTYLKVKSGLLGVKMDSEELNKEIEESSKKANKGEQSPEEKAKAEEEKRKNTQDRAKGLVASRFSKMFWEEDLDLDVFHKSRKYDFRVEGFAQMDNSIVYIVGFQPKRKADYRGKIYVNTEDFGVHRLDFENLRPLKKFSLFGVSTIDDVHRGKMIFTREEGGKYEPKYFEEEKGSAIGIDRPLTFLVKKGKFLFKKKLEELDLEMNINMSSINKTQMVIYESSSLERDKFDAFKPSLDFEYEVFKKYNPGFWSGNNIIEPDAAIKSFTSMEVE